MKSLSVPLKLTQYCELTIVQFFKKDFWSFAPQNNPMREAPLLLFYRLLWTWRAGYAVLYEGHFTADECWKTCDLNPAVCPQSLCCHPSRG